MSWRDGVDDHFDKHAGRNAFRNQASLNERSTLQAMKSFTESVDMDPDADMHEVPEHNLEMKSSDTNDTIIEVIMRTAEPENSNADPQKGETQKYKMAVPGPGHSEQEHELHKSLIRDEEEEDMEVGGALHTVPSGRSAPPSAFSRHVRGGVTVPTDLRYAEQDADHAALRNEYNAVTMQRPRPTTPTQACAVETLAFLGAEGIQEKPKEKIKVVIPNKERGSKRRKSDMHDFYDSMTQQIPTQGRASVSGRTTPLNDYDGDILEENPNYKDKVPPHPVVHRRTSVEWENFEEQKERMEEILREKEKEAKETDNAQNVEKKSSMVHQAAEKTAAEVCEAAFPTEDLFGSHPATEKPEIISQSEEDEGEPEFSEDMQEERRKISTSQVPPLSTESEDVETEADQTVPSSTLPVSTVVVADVSTDVVEQTATAAPEALEAKTEEQTPEAQAEAYDPNAYPGYIWNYDLQQWDVDPNYQVPTDQQYNYEYDNSYYSQQGYDQGQYAAGYDQTAAGYDQTTVGYDPTTAGYNQNTAGYNQTTVGYDQNTVGYDQTTAGYSHTAAGFDQSTAGYDQSTVGYDQTTAGYNPTTAGYDQSTAGYDQSTTYDPNYDYNAYYQGYAQNTTGQDQNTAAYNQNAPGYDQTTTGYDQTTAAYDQSTTGYDQSAAGLEQNAAGYDQSAYVQQGYDQSYYNQQPIYDQSTAGYDQNRTGYDQNTTSYYQNGYGYDQTTATYDQSTTPYDQSTAAYSQNIQPYDSTTQDYAASGSQQQPQGYEPGTTTSSASHAWHTPEQFTTESPPVVTAPPARPAPPTETAHPARPAPPSRPAPPKVDAAPPAGPSEAPPPPRPPPAARPPPPRPQPPPAPKKEEEPEEDAWTQFKRMTDKVNVAVKSTEEQLKNLSETTAANDIKDESYMAQIGGTQSYEHNVMQKEIMKKMEQAKQDKLLKKKLKQQGKKAASPTFDPNEEDEMDKKSQELAMKMANMRSDIGNWQPPPGTASPLIKQHEEVKREDSLSAIPPRKRSSLKDVQMDSGGSLELPSLGVSNEPRDSITPVGDLAPDDPVLNAPAWTDFDSSTAFLPPSESGFFSKDKLESNDSEDPFDTTAVTAAATAADPFAPAQSALLTDDAYDPFTVQTVEDIMAAAKAKAEQALHESKHEDEEVDYFAPGRSSPGLSTPTPEGTSPEPSRPTGFEDDFKCQSGEMETPTPLYDEDDSQPLTEFIPKFSGEGWNLMIRHPLKKKSFMAERFWKPCFVRIRGNSVFVFNEKTDNTPIQEMMLQSTYSLSDTALQAYDVYGKIHTVKLQYVQYKEKVGIRAGQITRLMDGHLTKYGVPLEHSAQCTVLLKFGSLDALELQSFVSFVEDILFTLPANRTTKPIYKQDEVQVHCYDEYSAYVDKDGVLSDQKARVRMFCLAFLTGSPRLEIGLNDRRRQGKEIVRRKDILPMYTERWIRFENLEFNSTVDKSEFDRENVICLSPPDGCFFEIMRFRVRPPRNREKMLTIKSIMKIAGSKVEIRIEAMAAAQVQKTRGKESSRRQIPCEDITIRFPIPEAWIYIFREERHWGVGSVHSKKLRPGKVKNLKDRLLGAVQANESNLIEVAIGEAKYEHVYRSLVWRIPRLPEKHHAAYKAHLLRCRFELSSFDLMPDVFLPRCDVEFTMPLATVSNTVVRSVSVEQHEDSDRVEKFVRYVAKCQYKVEVDYVQCADLDVDTLDPSANPEQLMSTVPELHQPVFQPADVDQMHDGYRIDFPDQPERPADSSSDDEDDKVHKMPIIQIDMKNYGY